jgi:hypothetical protein
MQDMLNLNKYKAAYTAENLYHKENEFMLTHYAKKICTLQKGGACLDLGLGHGFTPELFNRNFERHVVIEGSAEIIEDYKRHEKNFLEDYRSICSGGSFCTFGTDFMRNHRRRRTL